MTGKYFFQRRIVVTGGAGFLGSHVVHKLRERGAEVLIPRRQDCDLRQWDDVGRLMGEGSPQIVIHLAAVVDSPAGEGNDAAIFYDNATMGMHVMEAARRFGVEKALFLGSASSYPEQAPIPYREEDFWSGTPDPSRAAYALAKKIALTQAQAYRLQHDFNALFLIPTNLYGPGDNFDPRTAYVIPALIHRFLAAGLAGEPEVVVGDGSATRDFLYVEDCAEAILLALERYNRSDPVNLGTGIEVSIRELVGHVARLTNFSGAVRWDRARTAGPARRCLDVQRAEREFGFRASTSLTNGLRKTVAWYRCRMLGGPAASDEPRMNSPSQGNTGRRRVAARAAPGRRPK